MNVDTNGFELGDVVRDNVTNIEGIVTGIHMYLTGCARVSIQPKVGKDNKVPDSYGSDVLQLSMVKAGLRHKAPVVAPRIGGPRDDPARHFPGER